MTIRADATDLQVATGEAPLPSRARWARYALAAASWALLTALLGQMFTVGMAVFVDPAWWAWHITVVHWYDWLTVVLLVLAFVGRASSKLKWLTALPIGLVYVQYASAGLHTSGTLQVLAAIHPVSAVLLFWVVTAIARHATGGLRAQTADGG
jgi:hypothetical protein